MTNKIKTEVATITKTNTNKSEIPIVYPSGKLYHAFDMAMKNKSVPESEFNEGYVLNGKRYMAYTENSVWDDFVNSMSEEHRKQFGDGAGGELKPKDNKPPKMASYASSSRMLYTLAKRYSTFSD